LTWLAIIAVAILCCLGYYTVNRWAPGGLKPLFKATIVLFAIGCIVYATGLWHYLGRKIPHIW
jgi:hypothetical protein